MICIFIQKLSAASHFAGCQVTWVSQHLLGASPCLGRVEGLQIYFCSSCLIPNQEQKIFAMIYDVLNVKKMAVINEIEVFPSRKLP